MYRHQTWTPTHRRFGQRYFLAWAAAAERCCGECDAAWRTAYLLRCNRWLQCSSWTQMVVTWLQPRMAMSPANCDRKRRWECRCAVRKITRRIRDGFWNGSIGDGCTT